MPPWLQKLDDVRCASSDLVPSNFCTANLRLTFSSPSRDGIELVNQWSATQDLQARNDIIGDILPVRHEGTNGIAISRDENSSEKA